MIKNTFSIKDLENLSGVKAHTIRIWEKRYELLQPSRSDTNIRYYDLHHLQKILNVSYLRRVGFKISSIASLTSEEIELKVRKIAQEEHHANVDLQELKLAMVNFDELLFNKVYHKVLKENDFAEVFNRLFIPFLEELGSLWQSNTINIAHEHFITNLIRQKLLVQADGMKRENTIPKKNVFVLFLPENEMHDLGLLFLNYKLLASGHRTIFLGASMQLETLPFFQRNEQKPIFVTYITVQPTLKKLPKFLEKFNKKLNHAPLMLLGYRTIDIDKNILTPNQKVFNSIKNCIEYFEELK